jgi:hypothetical protein
MKRWLNLRPSLRLKRKKREASPPRWVRQVVGARNEPSMKRKFSATIVEIENIEGENPRVVLQCSAGEIVSSKDRFAVPAIFCDQEYIIAATDRIKVIGKGKPSAEVGQTLEVEVISTSGA